MSFSGIIWSLTNGGAAITDTTDDGSSANGETTTAYEVFLRHDGDNPITSCKIYMEQYTGVYSGGATAAADFNEIRGWGDGVTAAAFGGVQFNMNATGSYPSASWTTYLTKITTGGSVVRTGVGDSAANGITISSLSGATSDGTVQAGTAPNVRFKMRVEVPANETVVGVRMYGLNLSFSYTS